VNSNNRSASVETAIRTNEVAALGPIRATGGRLSLWRGLRAGRGFFRTMEGAVGILFLLEFLTLSAIGIVLSAVGPAQAQVSGTGYVIASLYCAAAFVLMLDYQHLYTADAMHRATRGVLKIFAAAFFAFGTLAITALAASGHLSYDGIWLTAFAAAGIGAVVFGRAGFAVLLRTAALRDFFTRNVIIIGAGEDGQRLLRQLEESGQPWLRVRGLFDDRVRAPSHRIPRHLEGQRVLGTVQDALTFSRRVRIDDIVIALPWSAHQRIKEVVESTESIAADIHIGPDALGVLNRRQGFAVHDGFPALRISRKPVSGWNYVLKRITDLLMSGTALLLLSPVLLAIAAAIKLESRGPVLFCQPRYGLNNRTIHVLKFRSMYHEQQDVRAERLVTRGDPRVTKVGRFLRRSSLDELPQLINVLRSEMSIVGPRPHAKNAKAAGRMYQDVVLKYAHRHRIKPGITGWAQVNGWRGETDTDEKIVRRCEHDLYYIDHWSFFFDLWIIIATVIRVPFQKNAY
jgi:polysaccharide biosynthesis protein PslA